MRCDRAVTEDVRNQFGVKSHCATRSKVPFAQSGKIADRKQIYPDIISRETVDFRFQKQLLQDITFVFLFFSPMDAENVHPVLAKASSDLILIRSFMKCLSFGTYVPPSGSSLAACKVLARNSSSMYFQ